MQDVLQEITDTIKPAIKLSHDNTNNAISTHIDRLRAADVNLNSGDLQPDGTVVGAKPAADEADKLWWDCVGGVDNFGGEKQYAEAVEAAQEQLSNSRSAAATACQEEEDNRKHEAILDPESMRFVCDLSENLPEHNCDVQWNEFLEDFHHKDANGNEISSADNSAFSGFEHDVDNAFGAYAVLRKACNDAEEDKLQKQSAEGTAIEAYKAQHNLCVNKRSLRTEALCNFETFYNMKCARKSEYDELLVRIDTPGDDYSKADLKAEWETVSMTECLLEKVIASSTISVDQLMACEADFVVPDGHLEPDLKSDEYDSLTTRDSGDCRWDGEEPEEEQITFYNGKQWFLDGPAPEPPLASEGYKTEAFRPVFPFCDNIRTDVNPINQEPAGKR